MRKFQAALVGALVNACICAPALAQHSHPTLTAISCDGAVAVCAVGDEEFVRFITLNHHQVLTFGKTTGDDDCMYVGGRVDASGFPAAGWAMNCAELSDSIQFLTEVRKANGKTVWFDTDSVTFSGHGGEEIVSFHGALNGLRPGDTFMAIYAVENGAKTVDIIDAVEVDGIIGVNNVRGDGDTNDATRDCKFLSHAGGCIEQMDTQGIADSEEFDYLINP